MGNLGRNQGEGRVDAGKGKKEEKGHRPKLIRKRRKRIGLVLAAPESIYSERVVRGLSNVCWLYDYDLYIFAIQVHVSIGMGETLNGEMNIFRLIQNANIDALIIATLTLSELDDMSVANLVHNNLKKQFTGPVVSLDYPLFEYPIVSTDEGDAMTTLMTHILDDHCCRDIYILTGMKGNLVAEDRLAKCLKELDDRNILYKKDQIVFYGDFWYTSGENLASRIVGGEVPCPEAVVCLNDNMAMGLTNRLIEGGIRVPEDVKVVGFDGTYDAALNLPSITSYIPDISRTVMEAVNLLRTRIDPGKSLLPVQSSKEDGIRLGCSCGCEEDIFYKKKCLDKYAYLNTSKYVQEEIDQMDIGMLLNSYTFETLVCSGNVEDMVDGIYKHLHLLRPCRNFYLCLNPNWMNLDEVIREGYPEQMNLLVAAAVTATIQDAPDEEHREIPVLNPDVGEKLDPVTHRVSFNTVRLLPEAYLDHSTARCYTFLPVHFRDMEIGYGVFVYDMKSSNKMNTTTTNWLRFVNTAVEMVRNRNRLFYMAEYDELTGLLNRRGMENALRKKMEDICGQAKMMVFVLDVNDLKKINDTYGHNDGDFAIKIIGETIEKCFGKKDIVVRSGGDEFYVITVDERGTRFTESMLKMKLEAVRASIRETSEAYMEAGKPFELSASIGGVLVPFNANLDNAIHVADQRMYEDKRRYKEKRKKNKE